MYWTICLIGCLMAATASASCSGCCSCSCRNYKFVQYKRPSFYSMYEPSPPPSPPPCESVYNDQEHFCEPPLDAMYPAEPLPKLEPVVNRYLSSYIEAKPVHCQKCICSKPSSQRLMTNVPRYYKRRYCNEQMMEALSMRSPSYSQCGSCCSQYDQCSQCSHCGQYSPCSCSPIVFRSGSVPMSMPPSCIC